MKEDAASLLEQANGAYARNTWADAFELLEQADRLAPLGAEDLERLMWSAGMLDRDADMLAACERLFNGCLDAGRTDRAAHWASFSALRQFALGNMGRASAWMQRAQQLVDSFGRECAAKGYMLLPEIHRSLMTGDEPTAAAKAEQAVAIGERCGDKDLVAFAKCLHGRALIRLGKVEAGVALLDGAMLVAVDGALSPVMTGLVYCHLIATCRQVYALDRSREWTDALSAWCAAQPQMVQFNGLCLVHRAEILEMNGSWQEAVSEAQRATRSVARAIAAETEASATYEEAEIHRLRGEFDAAEQGYRLASRLGLEPQPGMALLRLAQGQGEQAAATLRRVLSATAHPLGRARLLPACVEIMLALGALDEARQMCGELEQIANRFATDILTAMALQARGQVELSESQPATALVRLRAAFTIWQRAGAPYIEARLRVSAGQACRMLGDEDGARLEFEAALATFEQLGAAPDVAHVVSLAPPPRQRSRDRLTQRELEVLGLVALGNTNKAIAIKLALSEKTVDRHLSNIFDKLGVSSRAAATAFALRHGML